MSASTLSLRGISGWNARLSSRSNLRLRSPGRMVRKAIDKVTGKRSAAVPAASSRSVSLPQSSGQLRRDSMSRTVTVRELAGEDARATTFVVSPVDRVEDLDDTAWVTRVLDGDETAARALVERLYPTVIKSVRSHLPRRTQEEDLTQAVFAKIFRKLDQFSGLVPLEHWVSRITVNTCINQLKHEAARPELRMGDLSEEEEAVVQHLASSKTELPGERSNAAREILEKLLARLRSDERLVITLLHLEELSTEEISRRTGWSIPLVKVKAFRARHKMRKIWNSLFGREEW